LEREVENAEVYLVKITIDLAND